MTNGTVYYTGLQQASDSIVKTNVQRISSPLSLIRQLEPKTFFFDTTNTYKINFPSSRQYGFIAQQVRTVLPELVTAVYKAPSIDSSGYQAGTDVSLLTMNYNAMIGLLTAGLQEQMSDLNAIKSDGGQIRDTLRIGLTNTLSDATFKTAIDTIANASATIAQLNPRSFYFDTAHAMSAYKMKLNNKKQYGLIAQDVQSVLPELVGVAHRPALYDSVGTQIAPSVDFKTLNYNAFIALLIKSNQEQQARISALETMMASCCSNSARHASVNSIDVELNNPEAIVLNQNVPNPFAEQTTISYSIPKNATAAQILFYDINGRQIKAVDITKKGKGQLNVYANDLSNGIYSYTLIVDGSIFETKKMIKQQ